MEKIINAPFTDNPAIDTKLKNELLYKRNREMASKIEEYIISNQTHFVVLGAGHYIGHQSIIELLETTKKYIIKRR